MLPLSGFTSEVNTTVLTDNMLSLIKLPRVFTIHQVPKVFHEDSIISGYRHPRSSATDCILSLFQLTNETLNIWTHFLPTWYSRATPVTLRGFLVNATYRGTYFGHTLFGSSHTRCSVDGHTINKLSV
ncbi:unnamed protein product [Oncorhynchus mykiss]|uniref:Uncharacterized protein n=1 Tax=Oncorhynchus mykiss TaxID=8022 RepID=A0A060Z3Q7_ONCMY|nr:unnamed protein product [Oncorhynchus mykiss]